MVNNTMDIMTQVILVFKRTEQKRKTKKNRKQEERKETNRTQKGRQNTTSISFKERFRYKGC